MHIAVPHKTTKEKAVAKIKESLAHGRAQIAQHAKITQEEWQGDTLNFNVELQGKTVTGTLEVTESEFVLDAKLPLMWRLFESRIESEIQKRVQGL